ncbi:MAG: helix-turn-helix domain-containing protein [Bacteroidota bacterium]
MSETLNVASSAEKKSLTLQKALSLFLAFGIHAVSMKDISDTVSISKKTLYLFFSSKEVLIKACVKKLIDQHLKEISLIENRAISSIEKVFLIYKSSLRHIANQNLAFYNDMKRDYPDIYSFYINGYGDFLNNKIFILLSEGQRNNEILAEIDLDVFCQTIFFKLKEFFSNKYRHQKNRQERILDCAILISLKRILKKPDLINWK